MNQNTQTQTKIEQCIEIPVGGLDDTSTCM